MLSRRSFLKFLLGLGINLTILTATDMHINFLKKISLILENKKASKVFFAPKSIKKMGSFTPFDDIKALAGIEMQGREAGSVGEGKAVEYLSERLRSLGLYPIGESEYQQVFTIPPVEKTFVSNRLVYALNKKDILLTPCVNLLGEIYGQKRNEIILICAHYDHMGIHHNKIYPGANDNASGVACVLSVLERLTKEGMPKGPSIVAAFWSGEEMGFLGSKYFIKNPLFPLRRIKAVFNVDTIGNGEIDDFAYWAENDNLAVQTLKTVAKASKVKISRLPMQGHNSDQHSFAQAGIPAVTMLSKEWLVKNHSVMDTIEFIKPEKINKACDVIFKAIKLLS